MEEEGPPCPLCPVEVCCVCGVCGGNRGTKDDDLVAGCDVGVINLDGVKWRVRVVRELGLVWCDVKVVRAEESSGFV